MASSCSLFSLLTLVFLALQLCSALELQEIRPWKGQERWSRLGKRDMSALDLRSVETFLWGDTDDFDAVLGNFTVYMPGDHENILSMERFDGMLKSIDCTPNGMTLKFEDDQTFAYAQRVWDWVNGADNHTFLMVAGSGDCGNNTRRIPYLVSSIAYDEGSNVARLNATTDEWKTLARSYELQVGRVAMPGETGLKTRDITKNLAMNVANEFPFKVKIEKEPILGELECDKCRTTGSINFEFRITQNVVGIPDGARFRMTPKGVTAQAKLKLNVGSNFKTKKEWKQTVASIPLNSISIPGNILEVGPFLDIDVGGEITGFEGSISIGSGATATLSDSAVLQADLLNPKNNDFSGWMPSVDVDPLSIEAKVSFAMQLFVMPAVRLRAEALGHGVQAGLELKMPFFEAKAEGIAAKDGGVCDDPKKTLGVEITPFWGAELKFEAGKSSGDGEAPVDVTIGTVSVPMGKGLCFGFNPDGDKPAAGGRPTSTKGGSIPTPSSSGSGGSCTASSGLKGTCISKSSCSSGGGESEAGHCPGDEDIQCCTYPTGSGESCTANGLAGKCMSTSACKGQSVPGHCNGPTDIQCCVQPPLKPIKASDVCTIKPSGLVGECVSIDSCKSLGGKSTAGFCPGQADIQCCTYGTCEVKGVSGVCQPTSSCKGTSTPGHCGGGDNIQCCTG